MNANLTNSFEIRKQDSLKVHLKNVQKMFLASYTGITSSGMSSFVSRVVANPGLSSLENAFRRRFGITIKSKGEFSFNLLNSSKL